MAKKRVYEQIATIIWVFIAIMGKICCAEILPHHVCYGKPPDKTVTFLIVMAEKTTHTNQGNSAFLSLNSERMLVLHLKHKLLAFDFYRIIVTQTQ